MNRIKLIRTCMALAAILLISPASFAQDKENQNGEEADTTKKKETIADKTKSSRKIDGLFTLYQDTVTGSLMMEVREDQLGKEFIYQSFSLGGPPELFLNQNMIRETWVFTIEKVFDKIHFRRENTSFYFEPGKAISKAANADVSAARFFTTKITVEDSASLLIPVDGMYLSEVLDRVKPVIIPKDPSQEFYNLGGLNKDKSHYMEIRSFPENTDVLVSLSYDDPMPKKDGGKDVTDARFVEVKMQHTFLSMPDNDYRPRFDDPRVGYFPVQRDNMSTTDVLDYHDLIERWHLVKKDPDAELSEPVEPIVWWVENTTPEEYVDVIVEAGLKWNEAFEKAGFKNAIVMKVMSDTASWDPSDIRYNVIRWVSSDLGFAIGPSFVNPRTGQILGADITMDFGMLKYTLNEEALFQSAFGAFDYGTELEMPAGAHKHMCTLSHGKKLQQGFARSVLELEDASEEDLKQLSYQFMTELVLHEMGHTLGLGHNMKASSVLNPEDVHNKEITSEMGLTGSVMDYTIVNVASDRKKQGHYYSIKTGPYDWWAIEYGYTPFSPEEEAEGLAEILSRSSDPLLTFGNDADIVSPGRGIDPRVQTWDMSSDMLAYATDRFILVNNSIAGLRKKFVKDGSSYHEMLYRFVMLQSQRNQMVKSVSGIIGGVYVDRSFAGQETEHKPFEPVPADRQREAMNVLNQYIFSPDAFKEDRQVYSYLQQQRRGWNFYRSTEDPKIQNYILSHHTRALDFILNPITLARVNNTSLYGNAYSVAEIMDDLVKSGFDADLRGEVNLFRQNLQGEIVKRLIAIVENKGGAYDHASAAAAFYSIQSLEKKLKKAKADDLQTSAHRNALIAQLQKAQKAD